MPEIPKTYEANKYEDGIYKLWEESGFFNPDNLKLPKNAKNYSIVMPPPNVTGVLHMGSAMMLAVEDLLIRYNRMQGKRTVWIPGTDHASIATQNRVEKDLKKEGLDRHILGKKEFLKRVEKFALDSQKTIIKQAKKMGSSCDWSRLAYTMDETRSCAVKNVFKLMYDDGLIYRGKRIVNWCPRCHSTLANDEVEYETQKTKIYTFKYDANFPFLISTTRPETKLGDTAVAVNPKDERYKKFIGQKIKANFVGIPLELEIISDRGVDMNFGTGALGVTPAHSMVDWKMAQKNKLRIIEVIDESAKIKESFGKFSGKSVAEARDEIVEELKKRGLLEKEDEIENNLSVCYRCSTPIEPLPSLQWFVDVNKKINKFKGKSIKETCFQAVKKGVFGNKPIKIIPKRFEKNYFTWMDNLEDWCVSRQIWFGHKLPVWYKDEEIYVGVKSPKGNNWTQDEDTLDTWFSSGLWTFSTMAKKPEDISIEKGKIKIDTKDFKNFHPTAILETMYDILFFWVARMIIMTTYGIGDIPFQDVYLHGCVRDKFGDKMSKSKPETNIDPLDVCDKYGTDAVRLSLLIGTTPGNDLKIYEEKIQNLRNFVTKIWNIYRYCIFSSPTFILTSDVRKEDLKSLSDKWIVSQLNNVISEVSIDLENYKFSLAGEKLQKFTWDELASWYLEIHKLEKNDKVLGYLLDKVLKLWHPFMPFVTEKIWQDAYKTKFKVRPLKFSRSNPGKMLMVEKWPVSDKKLIDKKAEKEFQDLQEMIGKIRNIRSSYHIDPRKIINAYSNKILNKEIIEKLARVKFSDPKGQKDRPLESGIDMVSGNSKIVLDIAESIDIEKEKKNLEKEIANLENLISKIECLLNNKNFLASAPREIVGNNKIKLNEYREKIKSQKELLKNIAKL
ncbi:MAG: valine--tRNA ligase [Candidatus Moranbacteria bacterium CG23_combo_of_CG06-09_8_20_14_all_35_22]|nr:MAG: valine--tRNA ligase [Candidatus Moranbacteria bacterium CG23_combo_of_CG06-09_8_20_14_all_35_22]